MATPAQQPTRAHHPRAVIFARLALATIFVACMFFSVTPPGRAALRAGALLAAVVSASGDTSARDRSDVRHTSFTLQASNGPAFVDLYEPRSGPPPVPGSREAVVLISGVGDNRQVPQLVNLLDAFTEVGVDVLTVTTPSLLDYSLTPDDADDVVQAFLYLRHHAGVNPHTVGLVGISAGDGPVCLAAADPRIRDQVAFVTSFGGYYDATDLLRDMGRRTLSFDGRTEAWQPQPVPLQVLANSVAPYLPGLEGDVIRAAFANGVTPIAPALLAAYSPATQAVYHLLAGDEPGQVAANLARLPAAVQALLVNLSPAHVLGQIRAPIYLMHDRHDEYVPFTESRDFAAALHAEGHPYQFVEFNIFQHVEVRGGLPIGELLGDSMRLFGLLFTVLGYGA
jgi:acetyl esterase/lipase